MSADCLWYSMTLMCFFSCIGILMLELKPSMTHLQCCGWGKEVLVYDPQLSCSLSQSTRPCPVCPVKKWILWTVLYILLAQYQIDWLWSVCPCSAIWLGCSGFKYLFHSTTCYSGYKLCDMFSILSLHWNKTHCSLPKKWTNLQIKQRMKRS